jgi:hypothetical protein
MRICDVLVLRIDSDVAEAIRGRRGVEIARVTIRDQTVGAYHHRVRAPVVAIGEPPVRVIPLERGDTSVCVDVLPLAQDGERAIRGAVERHLAIKRLLPEDIATHPCDLLRESSIDECCRRGSLRQRRACERKTERRGAVPDILHRRVVVQRRTIDQIRLSRPRTAVRPHRPDISIVERAVSTERAISRGREVVVRPLYKAADVVVHLAREENTGAAEYQAVVSLIDRNGFTSLGIGGMVVPGVRHRRLRHYGQRDVVHALRANGGFADGVAGQLEVAAVGRQLREAHMAGDALLPSLARVGRNGICVPRYSSERQQHQ